MLGSKPPVSVVIVCAFCKPAKSVESPPGRASCLRIAVLGEVQSSGFQTRPLTERIEASQKPVLTVAGPCRQSPACLENRKISRNPKCVSHLRKTKGSNTLLRKKTCTEYQRSRALLRSAFQVPAVTPGLSRHRLSHLSAMLPKARHSAAACAAKREQGAGRVHLSCR